jgi:protein-disulfide isomerase
MLSRRTLLSASATGGAVTVAGLTMAAPARSQGRRPAPETVNVEELMKAGPLGDVSMGKADAPVTMVEYASLTCGHCASFHTGTLPALKQKYVDTGKVRLVFREFPLNQLDAAVYMLARCMLQADGKAAGGNQDRYFALIDVLFRQQRVWAFGNDPLAAITAITRQAGMTQPEFETCLNNQAILDGLNATRDRAVNAFGVESTPTFFVNGKRVLGAQPLAEFEKIIDPLLPA